MLRFGGVGIALKAFASTNKAAYRSKNPASPQNLLLIDNGLKTPNYTTGWAKWANVGIVDPNALMRHAGELRRRGIWIYWVSIIALVFIIDSQQFGDVVVRTDADGRQVRIVKRSSRTRTRSMNSA